MKFADRAPQERTAITAWIRVIAMIRETACMEVGDDFRKIREKSISESPADVEKMLRFYAQYRGSGNSVSYSQYFQVSHPDEYAGVLAAEKILDSELPKKASARKVHAPL